MSAYVYILSSLPTLLYDNDLHIKSNDFLHMCSTNLDHADYSMVECASLVPSMHVLENNSVIHSVLRAWYYWDVILRNELVQLRANKLGLNAENYLFPMYLFAINEYAIDISSQVEIARNAMQMNNPLDMLKMISYERWLVLERLQEVHKFDLASVILAYLKIQLLEYIHDLSVEKGRKEYQEIYAYYEKNFNAGEVKIGA